MAIEALKFIRKMRGGAQGHLIQCDDSHSYVVKFSNNPQHQRTLVNELVAAVFLDYLRIAAPECEIVRFSSEFLAENLQVYLQLGSKRVSIPAGLHFGSRYPGDPSSQVVYDFLPDVLLAKVENLADFLGILAFDKWTGNTDSRQSIFFRPRPRNETLATTPPLRGGFVASMMDHGMVFNGRHWDFIDSPLQGLYFRPQVYELIRSIDDFEPWIDRIRHFPDNILDDAVKQVPKSWIDPDVDHIEKLFDQLRSRRSRVGDLIDDCRRGRVNPFPNWL